MNTGGLNSKDAADALRSISTAKLSSDKTICEIRKEADKLESDILTLLNEFYVENTTTPIVTIGNINESGPMGVITNVGFNVKVKMEI